jgi:hypothetical protein
MVDAGVQVKPCQEPTNYELTCWCGVQRPYHPDAGFAVVSVVPGHVVQEARQLSVALVVTPAAGWNDAGGRG